MSISNDYLDIDSIESTQLLAPLAKTIHDDDMVVLGCAVNIVFQTHQKSWFWLTNTTNSVSKELRLWKECFTALRFSPVVNILRKLAPIISLNISDMTEKDLTLIAEIGQFIRENIKTSDEFLHAFIAASLGNNEPEIRQKLFAFSREQFENLMADDKQKIQNSSDLELFQEIQSLFPNLVFAVKLLGNTNIETPADAKEKEISKISNCYADAIKEVRKRSEIKQLDKITFVVALLKRSDLRECKTGYYQVSNQKHGEWIWKPRPQSQ